MPARQGVQAFGINAYQLINPYGERHLGFRCICPVLPLGNFIASLFLKCNNDAVALVGETSPPPQEKVPEPSSILGLTITGLMFDVLGNADISGQFSQMNRNCDNCDKCSHSSDFSPRMSKVDS
ncbi:PEP-CTERM sorting domain-containing protein [Cyanobacteria bacterium FACHB-472]|nr:PEP-CTERM sorting domain-containing protein [Cyanobacteria bacterium FACHB-472]